MRPLLAAKAELVDVKLGYWVSPKLDGVRALNIGGEMMTRAKKPIPNIYLRTLWSLPEIAGLDGEFIVGKPNDPDVYRITNSAVMTHSGSPEATFYVFDDFTHPELPYRERFVLLENRVSELAKTHRVKLVPQLVAGDVEAIEQSFIEEGFEGLMARNPDRPYKFGRSTLREGTLLKVKRFLDGEALITGVQELLHNNNKQEVNELGLTKRSSKKEGLVGSGVLGALEARDVETGVEFSIGSGFTQTERESLWARREQLVGRMITYRHFPVGVKDKPRFPTFVGFRDPQEVSNG